MTAAKIHLIYSLLLAHCFSLAPDDEAAIIKEWQCSPFGELVQWPHGTSYEDAIKEWRAPERVKICSMPSEAEKLNAAFELAQLFNLEGVAGFYRDDAALPGPEGAVRRELIEDYGEWRINLPLSCAECGEWASGGVCRNCEEGSGRALKRTRRRPSSALLVPYDNGGSLIVGIRVYKHVKDRHPFLLSSRGLSGGAPAVPFVSTTCFADPNWAIRAAADKTARQLSPGDCVREVNDVDPLDGVVVGVSEHPAFLRVKWANHDHIALVARDQVVGV